MRVSLFGLFLRCTSLTKSWPKLVQSVLLVIGFYIGFPVLWLLCYICSYHALYLYSNPPVSCSYLIISWVLPTWYYLLYTFVLVLARHLAFASPLAWGVSSDSPGSSCPGFGAWSVWIPPVADQSGAAVAWIPSGPSGTPSFQAPCVPLEFPFCKLVSALFTVHSFIFLVFSQLRHSGDVIFL